MQPRPCPPMKFCDLKQLSSGSFGQVFTAQESDTGRELVIKRVPNDQRRVEKEINAYKRMPRGKGLPDFLGHHSTANHSYLIFGRIEGTDLQQLMQRIQGQMSESTIRCLMRSVVSTLLNCHNLGVAHRDIKLENIMVNNSLDSAVLIDFGLCTFFERTPEGTEILTEDFCGSIEYLAPEIICRSPHEASRSDIWSLGVVFFTLVYGRFPFAVVDSLSRRRNPFGSFRESVSLPDDIEVSAEIKDLLNGMLMYDWKKRMTTKEVAEHVWLSTN